MYRAYVRAGSTSKAEEKAEPAPEEKTEPEREESDLKDEAVDEGVSEEINKVWRAVEKQSGDGKCSVKSSQDADIYTDLGWVVIRVFVSSTFNDFFNEREVLVKKVFPELREWCSERGMKFVECDLRWGIPKDTSTGDTILVCLDEIQRCYDENKGVPFFIGLIGERYGWMPNADEVPDEAREKYAWIDKSSITFNEILTGALRDKNPNAAFFFRDGAICKLIPESFQQRFVESEPLPKHHLKVMKQKIEEKCPNQVYHYSCKYNGISTSTGREQVEFIELDDFAQKVLTFFKSAIERTYPCSLGQTDSDKDKIKLEQTMQRIFIIDKAKSLIGRQAELKLLMDFVENGNATKLEVTDGAESKIRKATDWDLHETDGKVCVVQGQSGLGKSALLCRLVDDCVAKNMNVFYHMVGSTPSSIQVEILLERLVKALAPEMLDKGNEEEGKEKSIGADELRQRFRKALGAFREKPEKTLVIFIDALDQLENSNNLHHLSWLPPTFPSNIRCVVSTSSHQPTRTRLYEFPVLRMNLQALPAEDLQQIMTRYLGTFSKTLEPGQVEKIIKDTGANSPLWVMLMAEELRIFGDFRLMADLIRTFPPSMDEFLVQVLERLIREDDEHGVIKKVLCVIACSRSGGVPSQFLLQLCGNVKAREELPLMYWARARRALKPYLRVSNVVEDAVTFSHQAVTKAVNSLLLSSRPAISECHTLMADYYQNWCNDASVKVYNLPFHLQGANLKERIVEFVTKDKDAYKKMYHWDRSELLKDTRCRTLADSAMPNTGPALLCHSCVTFKRFNPACMWPTKDCCVLCSEYIGPPARAAGHRSVPARACAMHAQRRGPDKYKCLLCNIVVQDKPGAPPGLTVPTPARLCSRCGFGNDGKRCVHFSCF